ncbi:hypothetical protein OH807_30500 [Kitasatospora sp. NBC_01560]|uniref:hypothetical protein n=1 Tax=Kitasatospora sp. NBC_01560 TaxID=2975965 RepID=UPI00386F3612
MAARKPPAKTTAAAPNAPSGPVAEQPAAPAPAAAPGVELSAAAPLEPPTDASPPPPPSVDPPASPGITLHQPLASADVVLVDEDGNELPPVLADLFDLTHPEWTVVYPRVRIYQRRTYTGSRRSVTRLLYTPSQSVPRAEVDQLRQALGWE